MFGENAVRRRFQKGWLVIWSTNRRVPYTDAGIRRMKCARCGGPAVFQWNICADGNRFRPLCAPCDIDLNEMVLRWAGHPQADRLIERYRQTAADRAGL